MGLCSSNLRYGDDCVYCRVSRIMTRALLHQTADFLASVTYQGPSHSKLKAEIEEELAKPEQSPAWHDAPTVAGNWIQRNGKKRCSEYIFIYDPSFVEDLMGRWYGPIPEDNT
jgi:hypothetical protein